MRTDLWARLKNAQKPILLYGMGNGADGVIKRLKKENISVSGFFASDEFVRGQLFHSLPVLTYAQAKKKWQDFIVLTAFGTTDETVIKNIMAMSRERELYVPDVPVYGNTVFDADFYNDNKKDIEFIKNSLSDERSTLVFDSIIDFKLSGDINKLFAAEDDELSSIKEIIKLKSGCNIFDLGAFIGDTAIKFSQIYQNYGKIVAVEPSKKNFFKLTQANIERLIGVNCAVSFLDGVMRFGNEGGRNQYIDAGNTQTPTITIDSLAEKYGAPDFIKFDIEGQELNALIGGENTIKNHKPALMISAYHRGEDIVSIPKKVLSLRSDYKMYVRHFPCIPCWDTYYFFV